MQALIIAAGKGSRLSQRYAAKPLLPILGVPLIERVLVSGRSAGIDEFVVVTGFQGPEVRQRLDMFATQTGIPIRHVVNEQWELPNGMSVLQAQTVMKDPFVLLMSDHLFDHTILKDLTMSPLDTGETILAVDGNLENPHVDLEDVTRVQANNGFIDKVGKGISPYNAYDTGIFLCSAGLFEAIRRSREMHGDASLSGGINVLASSGKVRTFEIGGRFWLDVDDPRSADLAEHLLSAERPFRANASGV